MAAPGYSARLHAALLAPRAAAEALCVGAAVPGAPRPRGGLTDAAWLLGLRLAASEAQTVVRGALRVPLEGPAALLSALSQAASALVPDLLLIALGGVLMGLLLGGRERLLRPGLTMDLSALAWVGWVAVHALAALGLTLAQAAPGETGRTVVQVLGLLAFARGWGYAFAVVRAASLAAAQEKKPEA